MIRIVTALHAEARPLIDHFSLRARQGKPPFPLFEGDDAVLVVSGIGRVSCAAATGWLGGATAPGGGSGWLNVGVCGHASLAPGTCRIAHRIEDATAGRRWYPPQILDNSCESASLRTVERPETVYPCDSLYDMEASGFYPSALRFASAELVQCIKVVSDNAGSDPSRITPGFVEGLVSEVMPRIAQFAGQIGKLAADLESIHADPPETAAFLSRWRFTVTQRHQLLELLQRWRALHPDRPLDPGDFPTRATTKALLREMRARTDHPPSPGDIAG
ncbi:MAG: hypothetical protein U9R74_08470 [Pseudomonadota bacterium]|nr:hypothetical protein [Pseudomonadota bacterium]